jgi:hypothetical protein
LITRFEVVIAVPSARLHHRHLAQYFVSMGEAGHAGADFFDDAGKVHTHRAESACPS